jgi:hypothetical protein
MRDQDRQTERQEERWGSAGVRSLVVPAGIIDGLRRAVFAAIGEAAEAINEAAFAEDREEHSEWFVLPTNDLVEIYELMEMIGWAATVPSVSVRVDLWTHGRVLARTLRGALDLAEADAEEDARVPAEQSETAHSAEHGAAIEHVEALRAFIVVARARLDAIERGDA